MSSRNVLLILKNKSGIRVVDRETYSQMESAGYEVSFLYPESTYTFPKVGTFKSPYPNFTEEPHTVKVSWYGEVAELKFGISRRSAFAAVKAAVETSGLNPDDFLRYFYVLYKAEEFSAQKGNHGTGV